jgi:hypothetical protein
MSAPTDRFIFDIWQNTIEDAKIGEEEINKLLNLVDDIIATLKSPSVKDGLLVYLNLLLFEQIPILQFTA